MRLIKILFQLFVYLILGVGCNDKVSFTKKMSESVLSDTTHYGEYRYLMSLEGERYSSPRTVIVPSIMELDYPSFLALDTITRLKILRLMRLPSVDLHRMDNGDAVEFYLDKANCINCLDIHPHGIYAPIPTEYLLAFSNVKQLKTPLCPNAVRDVLSQMKNLESVELVILSLKAFTLDLSGLDIKHIKNLVIIGHFCEQIIFPKENTIEELILLECNIKDFDQSFHNLKNLRRLGLSNLPLEKIDIDGMDKLDSIWLESPNQEELLQNTPNGLAIQYALSPWYLKLGGIERDSAATNKYYQKQVAAMKCDCE